MREVVLVVNGRSRSGADQGQAAQVALVEAGFDVRDFVLVTESVDFERVVRRLVQDQAPLIAIGGGDGTQRAAASLIAGSASTMAVVPLGTGNAWAKDLGVPTDMPSMAAAYAAGESEKIDLGVANGQGFVNVATVGLTALIVKNLPKAIKKKAGKIAYLPAVVQSLMEMKPFGLKVQADTAEEDYDGDAIVFVAAAGRTHAGPFRVTRSASNNDGLLSLYALDNTDKAGLVKFGLGLLTGIHTFFTEVWSCETPSALVKTRPPKKVVVDGEPSGVTPLSLTIRPRELSILMPGKGEK